MNLRWITVEVNTREELLHLQAIHVTTSGEDLLEQVAVSIIIIIIT